MSLLEHGDQTIRQGACRALGRIKVRLSCVGLIIEIGSLKIIIITLYFNDGLVVCSDSVLK